MSAYSKIIFHLDASGLAYDPSEPIHLDALLAWALAPIHKTRKDLTREDLPDEIPLPLARFSINGDWVWRASALFPAEKNCPESLRFWRKKFRQNRAELTQGSPNLTSETYREWNQPLPLILCTEMVGYAAGKAARLRHVLSRISHLGKKRSQGLGKIVGLEVIPIPPEEDCSIKRDGLAMRWLPSPNGFRIVRPRPPYWNPNGAVRCCEVLSPIS